MVQSGSLRAGARGCVPFRTWKSSGRSPKSPPHPAGLSSQAQEEALMDPQTLTADSTGRHKTMFWGWKQEEQTSRALEQKWPNTKRNTD